ncbi:hypothetical protein AGR7A_Cc230048 [Agrobacterium deltaense NCPPB 1641]|uniref:Uncharacterized protein n=1 Tax=Agrobacterium deltaense NCPPB 1641 TaxID=1183425 RepID=A0A1S7TMK9_9HYPH|nr:hypothetical protein AGR7A_Cc230048 [Agrobacterium deltaense NCPPB 1641]
MAVAACFFSPRGRSPRQRDEGASVEIFGELAPSSDPSGHLLPLGEKKPSRFRLSKPPPKKRQPCQIEAARPCSAGAAA